MSDYDKVKAVTDILDSGVKELFESERYKEYLSVMSKFHRYSARNSLLIALQNSNASYVAGFGAWKTMGRSVNKGEKGIQILAPSPYTKTVEITHGKNGEVLPEPQKKEVTVTAFRPAYVFDVSQTNGRELPRLVTQLMGSVPDHDKLMRCLREASPCPIQFDGSISGNANGYYDPEENHIGIRLGMSEAQTIKTVVHEIAHAQLGHGDNPEINRSTGEVQAESVAFVVCRHFNIDSSQYSFGYIARWSKDKELPQLHNSLAIIQKAASDIIGKVEMSLAKEHDMEKNVVQEVAKDAPIQPQNDEVKYKIFYGGSGGQDKEAHDFQRETGWNMVWGSDSNGLNGDTWIVYRSIDDVPKQLKKVVSELSALAAPKSVSKISEKLAAAKKECANRQVASQNHQQTKKHNRER